MLTPLSLEARIAVSGASFDEASREVDIVWSTGSDVERYDWNTDRRYIERLSMDPAHIRIERLNAGGPLLDSHSAWSVSDILGAVVPGSVAISKGEARARVKFSSRDEVAGIIRDVRDGIVRSVSVGYRVHQYEETTPKGNKLPIRLATDWEPFEVSMVPIPADAAAATRGARPVDTNQCEIVTRTSSAATSAPSPSHKEKEAMKPKMTTPNADATRATDNPADEAHLDDARLGELEGEGDGDDSPEFLAEDPVSAIARAETPVRAAAPTPDDATIATSAERARVQGITMACRAARMPQAVLDRLIADGVPLVDAQARVFTELRKRGGDLAGPQPNDARRPEITMGDDPLVHARSGISNAILHRVAPGFFKLEDNGRRYRGMTLIDVARAYLNSKGIRTSGMSRMEIAGVALGLDSRGGMHTTSDYANLLADVANKTLRAAYEAAPQTFTTIGRRVTLTDFKPVKRLSLGEAPALLEVLEHGEFKSGTIGEGKEQFQLATYGRKFAITRKALVNDDTDAFSRVPMLFGRSARNLESDLVWQQITANAAMGDGVVLFHADHGNLSGTSDAIAVASIGAGRTALRKQTGLDAATYLNLSARYLIVPPEKETIADQFVSTALLATQSSNVNPFAGRLEVISEPRLSGNSTTAWYLACDPAQIDMIEYGFLEGEEGPMVESRVGFDVDGLEIKCREDFAAKVIDHRGFYKNAGA